MPDGLAPPQIVFPDGSTQDTADETQAGIPPGVGRSQVAIAAGNEAQLVPYNRKRIALIIETPNVNCLLGVGDQTVTAADYTEDLAAGEAYVAPEPVLSHRALNNGPGPMNIKITEITVSVD